jgi:hypothetical protein
VREDLLLAPGAGSVAHARHLPDRPRKEADVTAEPQLDPLPDGVLDKLRRVSTSTVATQLYKRGFRQPQLLGVRPLSQVVDGFVAEAFTMRFIPAART